MKLLTSVLFVGLSTATITASAEKAQSEKHAQKATAHRQAVLTLLGSNMGPLGAMAKGNIPLDVAVVEKNAQRIGQLSLMLSDYFATDTSEHKVETEALAKIWQQPKEFAEKIDNLTLAANTLNKLAAEKADEGALKSAIGKVGQACGSCHDDFKKD